MNVLDIAILYTLIFSPIIAAFFISLIPSIDTGSKVTLSRFFAGVGFASFIRIFFIFLEKKIINQDLLLVGFTQLDIHLIIVLSKQNIFLYGAASAALLANMYLYEFNDTKSNIHHVAPFVLTFVLYITLCQNNIRISLPIISIASFIIYFLIGYGSKSRRGSTIFQMGISIFTCDAIALVLLQYRSTAPNDSFLYSALHLAIILPGLSRLCLPMCAPFAQKLFLNIDDREGPFLIIFLQLAGFLVLTFIRNEMGTIPHQFSLVVGLVATISALYVAILAVSELRKKLIPYYFLVFYSSMSAASLFFSTNDVYWYISTSLFLTNITCFFYATKASALLDQYGAIQPYNQAKLRANWFIAMGLLAGIPGLGIGASLWPAIFLFAKSQVFAVAKGYENTWILTGIIWGLSLILLSFALMRNVNAINYPKQNVQTGALFEQRLLFSSWVYVALLSWLIPIVTIIASSNLASGSIFNHE